MKGKTCLCSRTFRLKLSGDSFLPEFSHHELAQSNFRKKGLTVHTSEFTADKHHLVHLHGRNPTSLSRYALTKGSKRYFINFSRSLSASKLVGLIVDEGKDVLKRDSKCNLLQVVHSFKRAACSVPCAPICPHTHATTPISSAPRRGQ